MVLMVHLQPFPAVPRNSTASLSVHWGASPAVGRQPPRAALGPDIAVAKDRVLYQPEWTLSPHTTTPPSHWVRLRHSQLLPTCFR